MKVAERHKYWVPARFKAAVASLSIKADTHEGFGSKLPGQIERTWKRSLVCTDFFFARGLIRQM